MPLSRLSRHRLARNRSPSSRLNRLLLGSPMRNRRRASPTCSNPAPSSPPSRTPRRSKDRRTRSLSRKRRRPSSRMGRSRATGPCRRRTRTVSRRNTGTNSPTSRPRSVKRTVAAGLLALSLGWLGVHKFYLGYNTSGFIMLGTSILGGILTLSVASWAIWVIAIVEGIFYLSKSQTEFEQMYVINKREWF